MQLVFKFQKAEYFVANCYSSPARHKRANEPVNPFTVGTCRASGGLQSGFPAEMPQSWKKGCSKCTLLEYPLVIINLFRGEREKLSAYVGFCNCYAKNTLLFSMSAYDNAMTACKK